MHQALFLRTGYQAIIASYTFITADKGGTELSNLDILLALMEQESPSNSQLHGDENPYSPPHVPHSSDQSDDIPRDDRQPNSPPHVPHSTDQSDDIPRDDCQPDSPPPVPHSSDQSDVIPRDDCQPDSPPHVPHSSDQSDNIPCDDCQPDSPPHVPQPPPLKRREYELDPPRHRNQFAYELMLSLREEQYARKRSASNNQSKTTIDIDTCTTITLPPKRLWIQNKLITL